MKMRTLPLILTAGLALAVFAPRAQAQAGTETITVVDSGCTTANPCTLQLSREALGAGVSTCDPAGGVKYSALNTASVTPSVGSLNTAWVYADTAIVQGVTYCYVATVTQTGSGTASPASSPFQAPIPAAAPPPAPSVTGAYQPAI